MGRLQCGYPKFLPAIPNHPAEAALLEVKTQVAEPRPDQFFFKRSVNHSRNRAAIVGRVNPEARRTGDVRFEISKPPIDSVGTAIVGCVKGLVAWRDVSRRSDPVHARGTDLL